ncbi:MAG: hypothetical protein M3294_04535 [Pseudomonadota bacterium]|nr:hypothetical protein [Pseudomonadota bacterium]
MPPFISSHTEPSSLDIEMLHHLTSWARWCLVFVGMWLLLVGNYKLAEVVAGFVAAAIAAALIELSCAVGPMHIHLQYGALRPIC